MGGPIAGNCDHNDAPHSSCRACDRIAGYVSAPLRTYGSHDVFPGTSRTVVWLLGEKCENDHCWKESDGGRRRTWIRLEIDREAPSNGAFERSLGPYYAYRTDVFADTVNNRVTRYRTGRGRKDISCGHFTVEENGAWE